jgi:hypothetical protein
MSDLIPLEPIERRILTLRGHKAMLDTDLADLYEVEVRVLVQAVKRNSERFPGDFMFQLELDEWNALRSQIVILKGEEARGRHRKYRPYAFTEQGVAMLSSVLRSERAVQVNIAIMRVFVQMRQAMASHTDLARRLDELEATYDKQFEAVFDAIRMLMDEPDKGTHQMGFRL